MRNKLPGAVRYKNQIKRNKNGSKRVTLYQKNDKKMQKSFLLLSFFHLTVYHQNDIKKSKNDFSQAQKVKMIP